MKTIRSFFVFILILGSVNSLFAQSTKKEKQAAKAAQLKNMVEAHNYLFTADQANPTRGGMKQLTYGYDLKVTKDTVVAYLPYYGRAYVAPIGTTDGGIKFTSTNFDYTSTEGKNGGYNIVIKPKDSDQNDFKGVRYLRLSITSSGYASLQVISSNRDAISFNGSIEEIKPKK
ncbi:DUF4251 domain-containing protein [Mucilaginibacter sp.]|uniref:DUF4251 domain-containing protein n=1 Tax=Mucilaginibacter sp. TaxID=1882438 RepID=UPI003D12973B